MLEWLKRHAWKACRRQKCHGGSNPPLSAQDSKKTLRAFSSAGSERLPYKQRVGGSNPSTPTNYDIVFRYILKKKHIIMARQLN